MSRAQLTAEKVETGYRVLATLPDGTKEYPQEDLIQMTKENCYSAMSCLYRSSVWDYNADNHTIDID